MYTEPGYQLHDQCPDPYATHVHQLGEIQSSSTLLLVETLLQENTFRAVDFCSGHWSVRCTATQPDNR